MSNPYADLNVRRLHLDTTTLHRLSKRRLNKKINKNIWNKTFWLLLAFVFVFGAVVQIFKHKITPREDIKENSVKKIIQTDLPNTNTKTTDQLLTEIKNTFEGKVGLYSVYVYNLSTKKGFGINDQTVFTAASVAKVPILASLYHLADIEDISLDDTITLRQQDIQDFGTGILRYQKPGTVYSIKTLARLMMEKSDNTAAYILGSVIIGLPRIQELIQGWGLTQTDMSKNKSSVQDMAILMTKMYQGEIANETLTKEFFGFMSNTDFEDRLPALLPKGIIIYHKTGDEIENTHDVGIVNIPNHPYFIGIMTLDLLEGEDQVKQSIAQVSKLVYDYMNSDLIEN